MRAVCSAVIVLSCLLRAPAAQQEGSPEPERVYFSALDKSERPVPGLTAADFELRVDGVAAELRGFRGALRQGDKSIPLVTWVLVDFNPRVDARMIAAQAEISDRVAAMFHPASAIGVKLFSDRLETLAPLAQSAAGLRDGLRLFGRKRNELAAGPAADTVRLGKGGFLSGLVYAARELSDYARGDPPLRGIEVHKAIVILSDGNVSPDVRRSPVIDALAKERVFLYPVFVPRDRYGPWLSDYFDLARMTGGVASVFGALSPGSDVLRLPRANTGAGALAFNFMNIARDLNGKYSLLPPPGAGPHRISVKCRAKNVRIRLPLENY